MTTLLSLLGGSLGALIAEVLNFFKERQKNQHEIELKKMDMEQSQHDNKHEMEMLTKSAENQIKFKQLDYENEDKKRDSSEYKLALKNQETPFLDASKVSLWDKMTKSVRPVTTYYFLILFGIYKITHFIISVILINDTVKEGESFPLNEVLPLLKQLWGEKEWIIFCSIMSFWFTKQAFKALPTLLEPIKKRF